LRFRTDLNIRVPECEILMVSHAVKSFIRNRDFFKIVSSLETGAEHGMWTFQRYRNWLDQRTNWYIPGENPEPPDTEAAETGPPAPVLPAFAPAAKPARIDSTTAPANPSSAPKKNPGRIEIEPIDGGFGKILKRPNE
jgi:twitching motility protein PilT